MCKFVFLYRIWIFFLHLIDPLQIKIYDRRLTFLFPLLSKSELYTGFLINASLFGETERASQPMKPRSTTIKFQTKT